jgi:pectinesterase
MQWNTVPALYAEYNCFGPGYRPAQRVSWSTPQLPDSVGVMYTVSNIFSKYSISPAFAAHWIPEKSKKDTTLVSVHENEMKLVPKEFKLENAYPNPFNPTTHLQFSLEKNGAATLKIFNILGQRIATLFEGNAVAGILYKKDFYAGGLSSGLYYARLESGGMYQIQKILLMK